MPELYRRTGFNRAKIYSTLSKMVVRGMCSERIDGRNRFFTALDPETVKKSLIQQWENDKQSKYELAESLFNRLEEHYKNAGNGTPRNIVELIRNPNNIHNRFLQLIEGCRKELLAFNRPPFAATTQKARDVQNQAQIEAMDRGVIIKSIIDLEGVKGKNLEYESIHKNDLLRVTPHLPIKLFIFDREKVFIGLPSTTEGGFNHFTMMYVNDAGFGELCGIAFDDIWDKSLPVERIEGNHVVWSQTE
ncbi:MAG: hypothetical protein D6762_05785 [Candidatus Neomarinimicrobiota bacterium]|nr:MAG: hypothetical protein D6762_05785 [Candidatus Neomarinimicrobiota bacterium]